MGIGFESLIYNVDEDAGSVTVCAAVPLVVDMERGRPLSVTFKTVSGSMFYKNNSSSYFLVSIVAREGSDFTSLATTRSLTPSRRRVCVRISINYDYDINERNETFTVYLTGQDLPSYVSLTRPSTTVQIRNIYSEFVEFIL